MRKVAVILAIMVTLLALGTGTAYAAQGSLPGEALYPVKLGTEQVMMLLPRDEVVKAERALSFTERRMREIEALVAEGRVQDLGLAVERYGDVLNLALARIEQARKGGLATQNMTARVAEATAGHLSVLDTVYDMVPDAAKVAIAHAREIAEKGRQNALAALARENTVQAAGMNLAAMEGRLNRVRTKAENMEAVQIALQQFETMAEFGEEISQIAQQVGKDIEMVEELIALATSEQLEELADIWEMVPERAQQAIERVMANLQIRHQRRIQALEQWGVEASPAPVIPEKIRESMEKRIQDEEKLREQLRTQEQQMEGILIQPTAPPPDVLVGAFHQYGPATTQRCK